jgi:hypothetical protein
MRPAFVKGALLAAFLFAGSHGVAAAQLPLTQPAISTIPELFILVAKKKKRMIAFHGAIFAATTRTAAPITAEFPIRGTLCATFLDHLLLERGALRRVQRPSRFHDAAAASAVRGRRSSA